MYNHEKSIKEFFDSCDPLMRNITFNKYPVLTEGQMIYRNRHELPCGMELRGSAYQWTSNSSPIPHHAEETGNYPTST